MNIQKKITREIERELLLKQLDFPNKIFLHDNYGKGLPERVVEILLARLLYTPGKNILDVGYAGAMQCHLDMLSALPTRKYLTGVDIVSPTSKIERYYEDVTEEDICATKFISNSFDLIWCISTLEHLTYNRDTAAIKEMFRILVPGGKILITVPYGQFEDMGTQLIYNEYRWQVLLNNVSSMSHIREFYFHHTNRDGWHESQPEELIYTGYADQANAGAAAIAVAIITKNYGVGVVQLARH